MTRTILSSLAGAALLLASAAGPAASYQVKMNEVPVYRHQSGGSENAAGKKGLKLPANTSRPKGNRRAR